SVALHQIHRRDAGAGEIALAGMQRRERAVEEDEREADGAVVELYGAELALLAGVLRERRQHDAPHASGPERRLDAGGRLHEPTANARRIHGVRGAGASTGKQSESE